MGQCKPSTAFQTRINAMRFLGADCTTDKEETTVKGTQTLIKKKKE